MQWMSFRQVKLGIPAIAGAFARDPSLDVGIVGEAFAHERPVGPLDARGRSWPSRSVISVIFAVYGKEAVSLISMRPASIAERELYEAHRR
jgi:hypothetical protein